MKQNKLVTALALSLSLTLVSCGDDTDTAKTSTPANKAVSSLTTSTQKQSEILSYIPADTPLLALYVLDPNNPMPQNLKDKISNVYSSLGDIIKMSIEDSMNKYQAYAQTDEKATDNEENNKDEKALEFMDKWFSEEGLTKLGLSMDENEFALYAIDLFPVIRMTLAKSHSMGEVLDELLAKANEKQADNALKKEVSGSTVYQFGDKEFQVMIALKGNSITASFAPTREVDKLMGKLLGFEKPQQNLTQSSQYKDTLSKYNYMNNNLYWINIRDLADYFVNPGNHQTAMLDVMKVQEGMLSADCKTEILQMFDKMPRMVGGTTKLSDHQLNSHMVFEMQEGLGAKLATLSGRIPIALGDPKMTYGISFDIAAAKTLAQEFVSNIEAAPYKCEMFSNLNNNISQMKTKLDQPLPPFVGNFKGVNFIIDQLDLDLTKKDPNEMVKNLKAKVLLAVDNPEALQGMAEMMMPDLQKLGIKAGADAVNISSLIPVQGTQIPVNLDHLFFAMGSETMGISLGEGSNIELTQAVSNQSSSELLNLKITSELYKSIFAGITEFAGNLSVDAKKQMEIQNKAIKDMLWWESESIGLNFSDNGLEATIDINY